MSIVKKLFMKKVKPLSRELRDVKDSIEADYNNMEEKDLNELRFRKQATEQEKARRRQELAEQQLLEEEKNKEIKLVELEKKNELLEDQLKKYDPRTCKKCGRGTLSVEHEFNYTTNALTHIVKCSNCLFSKAIESTGTTVAVVKKITGKNANLPEIIDEKIAGFNIEDSYPKEDYPDLYPEPKKKKKEGDE